jgi:trans-aconitate methyltransferase
VTTAPDTAPQAKQSWSADSYSTHARFVADLAGAVVEWLDPREGERILDLGCGDGALTVKLVEAGAVVKGVDKSDDLLAAARKLGLDVEARPTARHWTLTKNSTRYSQTLHCTG